MVWKKTADAAKEWAGGIHPKFLYTAVQRGDLKCARYGAGRNLLFCEQWIEDWLIASANRGRVAQTTSGEIVPLQPRHAKPDAR